MSPTPGQSDERIGSEDMPALISRLAPEARRWRDFLPENRNFAVVGFGKMGILHSTILNLLRRNLVAAVVDQSRLTRLGGSKICRNLKFYGSVGQMLESEDPAAVYVTTPVGSHFNVVSSLLEAGVRNIFIEKPPARNFEELRLLIDRIRSNGTIMVGFQKRFALPFRHARMLIKNKVVGDVQMVSSHLKSSDILVPTNRFAHLGRGALLDLGIHLVDLLLWMFEIDGVDSANSRRIKTNVDDHFEACLRTKSNAKVTLDVTWSSPENRLPETYIEVRGSEGTLQVTEDYLKVRASEKHPLLCEKTELSVYKPQYYANLLPVNLADPEFTLEDIHFLHSIHSSAEPLTSLRDSSAPMRLVDELYEKACV